MAQGKKVDTETILKVMLSYTCTRNFSETSRILGIPKSTVVKLYKDNKDKEEYVQLCTQKKEEFVEKAIRIIDKATDLLEKRIDTALNNQNELDDLIDEVWYTDKKELNDTQKRNIVNKIQKMQINSLNEITTAVGTLYDKKNIAEHGVLGTTTPSVNINIVDNSNLEKTLYKEE